MSVVRVKDGVDFKIIAPAGFRILSAIDQCAAISLFDLTITSACDGLHSGPLDPHHTGEAYDVRSHDLPEDHKQWVLTYIMGVLNPNKSDKFYGFIEAPGTDNEHFHFQKKKGTVYP